MHQNKKNNKKYFLYLPVILLGLSSLFLLLRVFSLPKLKVSSKSKNYYQHAPSEVNDPRIVYFNNFLPLIASSENTKVKDIEVINQQYKVTSLSEYVKNNPKLMIRYSHLDCSDCIRSIVEIIKKSNFKNMSHIMLFTDYDSEKDFKVKYNSLNTTIPVIGNKALDQLNNQIEGKGLPYIFILDEDMVMHSIYMPMKEFTEDIASYLTIVLNKLNK